MGVPLAVLPPVALVTWGRMGTVALCGARAGSSSPGPEPRCFARCALDPFPRRRPGPLVGIARAFRSRADVGTYG